MSIDQEVVKTVAKEVLGRIDVAKLADRIAPKLADEVAKHCILLAQKEWDFSELLVAAIDDNKELKKLLATKIVKALS